MDLKRSPNWCWPDWESVHRGTSWCSASQPRGRTSGAPNRGQHNSKNQLFSQTSLTHPRAHAGVGQEGRPPRRCPFHRSRTSCAAGRTRIVPTRRRPRTACSPGHQPPYRPRPQDDADPGRDDRAGDGSPVQVRDVGEPTAHDQPRRAASPCAALWAIRFVLQSGNLAILWTARRARNRSKDQLAPHRLPHWRLDSAIIIGCRPGPRKRAVRHVRP